MFRLQLHWGPSPHRALILLAFVPTLASAGSISGVFPGVADAAGKCEFLKLVEQDETLTCSANMSSFAHSKKYNNFAFHFGVKIKRANRWSIIAFVGPDVLEASADGKTMILTLTRIVSDLFGPDRILKATGACEFTRLPDDNGLVDCKADTERGKYEGRFRTSIPLPDFSKM